MNTIKQGDCQPHKNGIMYFNRSTTATFLHVVPVGGNPLQVTKVTKVLSVIMDNRLTCALFNHRHPGLDKCLAPARSEYWTTMRNDVEFHVAEFLSYGQYKGSVSSLASILEYLIPDGLMDVTGIDLLKLPKSHQGSLTFSCASIILTNIRT